MIVAAMVMAFGLAACSDEPQATAEAASEPSVASEAAGEQTRPERDREAGEQREPGEDGGEGEEGEHSEEGEEHGGSQGEGEHGGSEGEGEHGEGGEEGEESGEYIAANATWDATRNGAKLVLSFDASANAFVGTVENTTERTICAVRVEVHLSNGPELGPTERTDLPSGETMAVRLATEGAEFESWTAHPERSACNDE